MIASYTCDRKSNIPTETVAMSTKSETKNPFHSVYHGKSFLLSHS